MDTPLKGCPGYSSKKRCKPLRGGLPFHQSGHGQGIQAEIPLEDMDLRTFLIELYDFGKVLAKCKKWDYYTSVAATVGTDCIIAVKLSGSTMHSDPEVENLLETNIKKWRFENVFVAKS